MSLKSKKLFVNGQTYICTYIRTYAQTDRWTFQTGFNRLTLSKSRPKNRKTSFMYAT